jgi:hypothetical protein
LKKEIAMNVIESAVIPRLALKVDGREYRVEFPLSAVIKAEEKTGRSLKSLADWFTLSAKDVPAVLEAGLSKHHADVKEADIQAICDRLNPEALDEILYALCKLAFPRRMSAIEEERAKGKTSPNAQSGDGN